MSRVVATLLVAWVYIYYCSSEETLDVISREKWGARPPKDRESTAPATLVVIHHTYDPTACSTREDCVLAMRYIQDMHMDKNNWSDIGYNFAVGGDAVYEGRGWEVQGAHAKGYNNHSLGIAFIGDYREVLPSAAMLEMCAELIQYGVANQHVLPDYTLVGHRQVRATECPGDALYKVVQGWKHWVPQAPGSTGVPSSLSTITLTTLLSLFTLYNCIK